MNNYDQFKGKNNYDLFISQMGKKRRKLIKNIF